MADTTAPLGAAWQVRARGRAATLTRLPVSAVRKVKAWRVHAAVPGLAGAGLVSAAIAVRFGVWAGLLAGGVFLLRIDSRL